MTRVICIGHALLAHDNAGWRLYQALKKRDLGPKVELIDGGLQGLNLLCFFEDCQRVILIDNVCGYLDGPGVVHLASPQLDTAVRQHHDHAAGLSYLLQMLPQLLESLPTIELIGIEGELNHRTEKQAIAQLEDLLKIGIAA